MKILFITQKMDFNDDLLGVYHGWVAKLAAQTERISVICLESGVHNLPANVTVCSLGKESKPSRLNYLINFYKYIWQLRRDYDVVFVHMNQEYVLLGGVFWKLWGKGIYFWRNHAKGNWLTNLAVIFSKKVFCASAYAYVKKFKRTVLMPVGTDLNLFKPSPSVKRQGNSILNIGRISPVKKLETLIKALKILKEENIRFEAKILAGTPFRDIAYAERLKDEAQKILAEDLIWQAAVPNWQTPAIYAQHEIFVNLTPSGSFDKTILEAMACGCLPLVSNASLKGQIDDRFIFQQDNPMDLAQKIKNVMALTETEKRNYQAKLREYVAENHSLNKLIEKLLNQLKN